ncbi:hemolin [Helicoverpa armigera]|uniref:hemolin n=1 Tax=Helicoverpa armigera TaxID=29058 RepID=UPI003083863B
MAPVTKGLILAACIVLCTAQPLEKREATQLPVLKDQPAEVLFRADNYSTVLLECATEGREKDVKYSWHKNGQPFDWEKAGHIAQRPGEGSIMFFNPQPSDEGKYQCFVETPSGTASTRIISLKRAFINAQKVETKEHTPTEGKPYKLECPIPESYPKPKIVWKTQLKSDPSIVEEFLSRRITLSPDGTLWFSNITESDVSPSFKYVCFAQTPASSEDVVLAEHFLKSMVQDKTPQNGELVPQYVSNDMMAKAGDVTMIYCIYGGTPLGFPSWYKDGKDADGKPGDRVTAYNRTSGKRLLIKETLLEDAGEYACIVDNGVGKKQTHKMRLTVVSAPKLSKKAEKVVTVKEGQDMSIPCQVTGLPEPKVSFTYNAKPLGDRATYKNGVLTIKNAKKSDTGYYGCKAENEHGDLYAETLVHVA